MVASAPAPVEGDVVANAGPAEGGYWLPNLFSNLLNEQMVGSAGPGGEGSYPIAGILDNLFFSTTGGDGMVAAAQDQNGPLTSFWSNLFSNNDDRVSAKRDYGDENLPYCEDV